jgi:N-acetylglutamate synthase-like GNAT family acetyltransferase
MNKAPSDKATPHISIRHELHPGDIGYIIYLHGILYAKEQGFDHTLDAYVAGPIAEFAKAHSPRERIWIVECDGKIVGSIAVIEFSQSEAQLRWLLLDPGVRGFGLGRHLVEDAVEFSRASGYSSVFLWTTDALLPAAMLYQSAGFKKTQEVTHELWGGVVTEVRYDLILKY